MKKSDLKDGMLITYRAASIQPRAPRVVRGDRLEMRYDPDYHMCLHAFNEDLTCRGDRNYDIMVVETPPVGTIIWAREEVVLVRERTVKEREIYSIRKEIDKLSARMKELEGDKI